MIVDLDADRDVETDHTVDGGGHVLLPGLVDIHVHLREPGREDTETVITGSQAAAKGGCTGCCSTGSGCSHGGAYSAPKTEKPSADKKE